MRAFRTHIDSDRNRIPRFLTETRVVLYVLPHPDDEVFCAGLFDLFDRCADRQCILWLSVGGLFPRWRRKERDRFRGVLRKAGIEVLTAELTDGSLALDVAGLAGAIGRAIDEIEPDAIVTTACEGGHPDHDATCLVCAELSRLCGGRRQLLVVPTYRSAGRGVAVGRSDDKGSIDWVSLRLGRGLIWKRLRSMVRYPSQWYILLPLAILGGIHFFTHQTVGRVGEAGVRSRPPGAMLYERFARLGRLLGLSIEPVARDELDKRIRSYVLTRSEKIDRDGSIKSRGDE